MIGAFGWDNIGRSFDGLRLRWVPSKWTVDGLPVPEATTAASSTPSPAASSRSRAAASGPWASWPERTTRLTRSTSSSEIDGRECGITARSDAQMFSKSRMLWKASAYFTRAWMPRKFAHERASSRIVMSSMFVLVTWERCASRLASFRSSTLSMLA